MFDGFGQPVVVTSAAQKARARGDSGARAVRNSIAKLYLPTLILVKAFMGMRPLVWGQAWH